MSRDDSRHHPNVGVPVPAAPGDVLPNHAGGDTVEGRTIKRMTPLQHLEQNLESLSKRVESNVQAEDDAHQRTLHGVSAHAPPPPSWRTVSDVLDVSLRLVEIIKDVTVEVEALREAAPRWPGRTNG